MCASVWGCITVALKEADSSSFLSVNCHEILVKSFPVAFSTSSGAPRLADRHASKSQPTLLGFKLNLKEQMYSCLSPYFLFSSLLLYDMNYFTFFSLTLHSS